MGEIAEDGQGKLLERSFGLDDLLEDRNHACHRHFLLTRFIEPTEIEECAKDLI